MPLTLHLRKLMGKMYAKITNKGKGKTNVGRYVISDERKNFVFITDMHVDERKIRIFH